MKFFIICVLSISSIMAYECKLVQQLDYNGISKTMHVEITPQYVTTAVKDNFGKYKSSRIKNVYIAEYPYAMDILQIEKNMLYINHYSPNGRAYQTWKCNTIPLNLR